MIKLFSLTSVAMLLLIVPRTDSPDTATLGGFVTGENGAGLAGAEISASNVFSGESEAAKTDASGAQKMNIQEIVFSSRLLQGNCAFEEVS
ncbi:MAG: carboxypeptidase-like regulatory domain-containing protein [Bryobacteraceae bacterium]